MNLVTLRQHGLNYDYVVCHDGHCPGDLVAGHGKDGDESNHHHHVFMDDERDEAEIRAEVEAREVDE